MEIERKLTGDVMGDNSLVDVDGAFGSSSRSTREMEKGHVFRRRRGNGVRVPGILHQTKIILRVGHIGRLMVFPDQHNMLEKRQRGVKRLHLTAIEQLGGDQHLCLANRQA